MGINISKTATAAPTTTTRSSTTDVLPPKFTDQLNGIQLKSTIENNLLDPRSPDVNRTPIILNNRLSKRPIVQPVPVTPVNLRKSLLNYSGKEMKFLDPRSPSQFIPRTPLNMSLNAENIDTSEQQFSLEYSGDIEEASCRNFNERLANITFDDLVREKENDNELKPSENQLDGIEDKPLAHAMDGLIEQNDEEESHTPNETMNQTNDNAIDMDDENISPVIAVSSAIVKRNAVAAFSSTPISTSTNHLKSMLLKNHNKKIANTTDIFTDDAQLTSNDIEMTTPTKRLAKINEVDGKPRTPFGCLLNRRSKSVENVSQQSFGLKENVRAFGLNDENATPKKQKPTNMLKHINQSGDVRRKNGIYLD